MLDISFNETQTTRFPTSDGVLRFEIRLHTNKPENPKARKETEAYIAQKYAQVHQAQIDQFYPNLLELCIGNELRACVGFRYAENDTLFLQQYLDLAANDLIAARSKDTCSRSGLVEIGNFAAESPLAGATLLTALAQLLVSRGYQWLIFTATNDVVRLLRYLDCRPITLSAAAPSALTINPQSWGSYYQNNPRVMACKLETCVQQSALTPRIKANFRRFAKQIHTLSAQMDAPVQVVV